MGNINTSSSGTSNNMNGSNANSNTRAAQFRKNSGLDRRNSISFGSSTGGAASGSISGMPTSSRSVRRGGLIQSSSSSPGNTGNKKKMFSRTDSCLMDL